MDAGGAKEALGEGARTKTATTGAAEKESGLFGTVERPDDRAAVAEENDAAQGAATLRQVHHYSRVPRPWKSRWWRLPGSWWHLIGDNCVMGVICNLQRW